VSRFCGRCGRPRTNLSARFCGKCGLKFHNGSIVEPIGRNVQTGELVYLEQQERSTYVIGAHGMGKSTFILMQVLRDIKRNDCGIVILDPHRDLVEAIMRYCPPEHAHRVVYFAPELQRDRPFGLNPFEWHTEQEYQHKVSAIVRVFTSLWGSDQSQKVWLEATLPVFVHTLLAGYKKYQTTFMHMLHLLRNTDEGKKWREKLSEEVKKDVVISGKWEQWLQPKGSTWNIDTQALERRVQTVLLNPVVRDILCQPRSSDCFHLQNFLAAKNILLVDLKNIGEESWRLLGSLILAQLHAMAFQRDIKGDRVPCTVYADEFDHFVPSMFVDVINKLRKFGLRVLITHQGFEQISDSALNAVLRCGNKVVFKVGSTEARTIGREIFYGTKYEPAMLASLPRFQVVVQLETEDGGTSLARVALSNVEDKPREDILIAISERSRKYGREPVVAATADDTKPIVTSSPPLSSAPQDDDEDWVVPNPRKRSNKNRKASEEQ